MVEIRKIGNGYAIFITRDVGISNKIVLAVEEFSELSEQIALLRGDSDEEVDLLWAADIKRDFPLQVEGLSLQQIAEKWREFSREKYCAGWMIPKLSDVQWCFGEKPEASSECVDPKGSKYAHPKFCGCEEKTSVKASEWIQERANGMLASKGYLGCQAWTQATLDFLDQHFNQNP